MACMVVTYRTPADSEAFDRHYFSVHVPLARKLPGLRGYETNDGPVATTGACEIYRVGILHFDDLAALKAAFASPEGQAAAEDRRRFAPDGSGFEMYIFDERAL